MNDVLEVALQRQRELRDEIAEIDGFIRLAQDLMRRAQPQIGMRAERPLRQIAPECERPAQALWERPGAERALRPMMEGPVMEGPVMEGPAVALAVRPAELMERPAMELAERPAAERAGLPAIGQAEGPAVERLDQPMAEMRTALLPDAQAATSAAAAASEPAAASESAPEPMQHGMAERRYPWSGAQPAVRRLNADEVGPTRKNIFRRDVSAAS